MWPFKKNKNPLPTSQPVVNSVLCVPGLWSSIDELTNKVFASSNGDWMIVGDIIINPKTQRHYKIEIRERDEFMRESFRVAGSITRIAEECLNKIEKNTFNVYITGATGNLPDAYELAIAACAILNAGGLGVRVETTGKAFDKQKWLQHIKNFEETDLFEMFVINTIVDNEGTTFSCGMHNLGLKDTIVSGLDFQTAVDLISIFGYYQIFEKPVILAGQTFQPNLQSPKYCVSDELNQPYQGSAYYGNPFGMWRLSLYFLIK